MRLRRNVGVAAESLPRRHSSMVSIHYLNTSPWTKSLAALRGKVGSTEFRRQYFPYHRVQSSGSCIALWLNDRNSDLSGLDPRHMLAKILTISSEMI